MNLRIIKSKWLNDIDIQSDYCLHGQVELFINKNKIAIYPQEITLSSTGLFLMRIIKENYEVAQKWGNYLFPCCGFTFYKNEETEEVKKNILVINQGCCNGTDLFIKHIGSNLLIKYQDNEEIISMEEYKKMVFEFVKTVEEKYKKNKKKNIKDRYEKEGYEAFWKEWYIRKNDLTIAST